MGLLLVESKKMASYFGVETQEEEDSFKMKPVTVVACEVCGISIKGEHFDGCSSLQAVKRRERRKGIKYRARERRRAAATATVAAPVEPPRSYSTVTATSIASFTFFAFFATLLFFTFCFFATVTLQLRALLALLSYLCSWH